MDPLFLAVTKSINDLDRDRKLNIEDNQGMRRAIHDAISFLQDGKDAVALRILKSAAQRHNIPEIIEEHIGDVAIPAFLLNQAE